MSALRIWFPLTLGVVFTALGTLFTFSPELLEHSPVGFEARGVIHHIWHYTVLIGGMALVIGVWLRDDLIEALGLAACGLAVLLNTLSISTADYDSIGTSFNTGASGIDIALRVIILVGVIVRLVQLKSEDR